MDKKKKSNRTSLSPITKLILRIVGLCTAYFLLIGSSYLPGVGKNIDYAVRELSEDYLTWSYPNYQIGTVSQDRRMEMDNILTIGFLTKAEIQSYLSAQQTSGNYVALNFKTTQLRIRELFITPLLIIALLFLFSPLPFLKKMLGFIIGVGISFVLLLLKLNAIMKFSITSSYYPNDVDGWLNMVPYFSSPGLVFLVLIIVWLGVMLPLADKKRIQQLFSFG